MPHSSRCSRCRPPPPFPPLLSDPSMVLAMQVPPRSSLLNQMWCTPHKFLNPKMFVDKRSPFRPFIKTVFRLHVHVKKYSSLLRPTEKTLAPPLLKIKNRHPSKMLGCYQKCARERRVWGRSRAWECGARGSRHAFGSRNVGAARVNLDCHCR